MKLSQLSAYAEEKYHITEEYQYDNFSILRNPATNEWIALLSDVDVISEGGASFRFIVGHYGSGKSFLIQTIRNYVMDKKFIVADADLSPERRLQGTKGQGLATYRELIKNLATKTKFLQRMGRTGRRGTPSEMWLVIPEDCPSPKATSAETISWQLIQSIAMIQLYIEERFVEPPKSGKLPFSLLYH